MTLEVAITNAAGACSITAFWMFGLNNALDKRRKITSTIGEVAMVICFACVSLALVVRGIEAARFPIANLYESLLLFSWGLLASFLLFWRGVRLPQLGWITALAVSTIFLYSSWLPASQHEIAPLMPALVSFWRVIHVPPLIVSYALLLLGGLLAIAQLWVNRRVATCIFALAALTVLLACVYMSTLGSVDQATVRLVFWTGSITACIAMIVSSQKEQKVESSRLAESLDEVSQKCISVAFPLLTFGIITGALWANHAWGSYWSWDPKESMSLATWLSYAGYLHLRARTKVSTCTLSCCAVLGLLLTLLTYLGFNFLGLGGLHSYGKIG